MHSNTVLSLQNTECILIPRAVLAAILPEPTVAALKKRMQAQANGIATMVGSSKVCV